MILPYVYRCTHKQTGQFYIGSRCKNKTISSVDILTYKTSSKYVKPIFDEFDVEIVAEFFNGVDAYDFEQRLIAENWKHPLLLNRSCFYETTRWSTVGIPHSEESKVKISESKIGRIHTEETKEKIRLAGIGNTHGAGNKGKKKGAMCDETKLKISNSRKEKKFKQTPEVTENLRRINTGRRWYTNGVVNIKSREPVEGFRLGLTPVRIYKKKEK